MTDWVLGGGVGEVDAVGLLADDDVCEAVVTGVLEIDGVELSGGGEMDGGLFDARDGDLDETKGVGEIGEGLRNDVGEGDGGVMMGGDERGEGLVDGDTGDVSAGGLAGGVERDEGILDGDAGEEVAVAVEGVEGLVAGDMAGEDTTMLAGDKGLERVCV